MWVHAVALSDSHYFVIHTSFFRLSVAAEVDSSVEELERDAAIEKWEAALAAQVGSLLNACM